MLFDLCLAPDTTRRDGIGCDNMTLLIVAITHGRTKKEWYQWVKKRVKMNYGYQTPTVIPEIYSQSRLLSYRKEAAAREAQERKKSNNPKAGDDALRVLGFQVWNFTFRR